MEGLWLERGELAFRGDIPPPEPPAGEALVRVRLAGICGTDLELVKGYYPYSGIPGHEFVGEIVKAPDAPVRCGQRVVGEINAVCGECRTCRSGLPRHCRRRTVLGIAGRHGAFAEYLTLPLDNLIEAPPSLADSEAVFAEPLAAALEIQEQVRVGPSDRVLLIGAGRLGQLIAQTLVLTGCELVVVVRHEPQRKILRARGIACIEEEEVRLPEADLVIEASGVPQGLQLALRAVRPGGTVVLKSTHKDETSVNFSSIVVNEIRLVGSRCGPFPPALRLLERRRVETAPLVTATLPLTSALEAFDLAARPGALKVLLRMPGE
ncbi:MAG: alcohol dehydrogenase catalytic domain-containing protein [Acidobacteriota bacterium]